jgi:hypothetical protein
VLHVTYKNLDEIARKVKTIIENSEEAENNEDISSLPFCPAFMNDDENCPLMSQCCANGEKGCKLF